VKLYTCPFETHGGNLPGPIAHPCGKAAKALDDAGLAYEIEKVGGGLGMPWTWPSRAKDRAEVERLSGQRKVPILVLDNGGVVAGSGEIVEWAEEHSASSSPDA
jgi:glutathione S-transferase